MLRERDREIEREIERESVCESLCASQRLTQSGQRKKLTKTRFIIFEADGSTKKYQTENDKEIKNVTVCHSFFSTSKHTHTKKSFISIYAQDCIF